MNLIGGKLYFRYFWRENISLIMLGFNSSIFLAANQILSYETLKPVNNGRLANKYKYTDREITAYRARFC